MNIIIRDGQLVTLFINESIDTLRYVVGTQCDSNLTNVSLLATGVGFVRRKGTVTHDEFSHRGLTEEPEKLTRYGTSDVHSKLDYCNCI